MKTLLKVLVGFFAILILGVLALIYFGQTALLYYPHPYSGPEAKYFAKPENYLPYTTTQGRQTAYYFPAKNGQTPKHLWVMFNGNASLTLLTWDQLLQQNPNPEDAFLLIDYPGYGNNEGSPSPKSIEASADAALAALQQKLGQPLPQLRVIGHSLGAAAAMQFAANHAVDRVILLSPFTSIGDMGKRMFYFAPTWLIRHNFDNAARLDELAKHNPQPKLIIFHGDYDEIIPVAMGRELAAKYPQMTTYHELNGIGHNDILGEIPLILDAMNGE